MTAPAAPTTPRSESRWRVGLRSHIITLLGLILFATLAYILISRQNQLNPTFDQKAAQARIERLEKLRQEDHVKLHTYGWIDPEAGILHIPIEKAIPMAAEQLKKKPVRLGSPITTPPVPSPAPPAPSDTSNSLTATPPPPNNS